MSRPVIHIYTRCILLVCAGEGAGGKASQVVVMFRLGETQSGHTICRVKTNRPVSKLYHSTPFLVVWSVLQDGAFLVLYCFFFFFFIRAHRTMESYGHVSLVPTVVLFPQSVGWDLVFAPGQLLANWLLPKAGCPKATHVSYGRPSATLEVCVFVRLVVGCKAMRHLQLNRPIHTHTSRQEVFFPFVHLSRATHRQKENPAFHNFFLF